MNEDDVNLNRDDYAQAAQRLREMTGMAVLTLPIPDGHYEAKDGVLYRTEVTASPECVVTVSQPAPLCDAARELALALQDSAYLIRDDDTPIFQEGAIALITSALTAHGEAVRERCSNAAWKAGRSGGCRDEVNEAFAAINLTEAL